MGQERFIVSMDQDGLFFHVQSKLDMEKSTSAWEWFPTWERIGLGCVSFSRIPKLVVRVWLRAPNQDCGRQQQQFFWHWHRTYRQNIPNRTVAGNGCRLDSTVTLAKYGQTCRPSGNNNHNHNNHATVVSSINNNQGAVLPTLENSPGTVSVNIFMRGQTMQHSYYLQ